MSTLEQLHGHTIVQASAGSGKTYLLVSRIVRLLLNGAEPGHILAITFTNKAANEMQTRLLQRLYELACCSEQQLQQQLQQLHIAPDAEYMARARALYEYLLRCQNPVKTTTFHAFCQDLLRRFPLEADIAPGFDLIDKTGALHDQAWQALMAHSQDNADIGDELEYLFQQLGLHNSKQALYSFLQHRSDWWAYTMHEAEPLAFARQQLQQQLEVDITSDPLSTLFADNDFIAQINNFHPLLCKHLTKAHQTQSDDIYTAIDDSKDIEQRFAALKAAFFTQQGEPRVRKESAVQAKKMGDAGQQQFLSLHQSICERIMQTMDSIAALQNYHVTNAWYIAGNALLECFQQLKKEQRLLDFTDLEWQAFLLLNHSNNAQWIQYKLDQRIEHLLIDEFQDTNPTQWRLILPLLQELAASDNPNERSVFIVGDKKQSIYRFRRAEPRLFDAAQQWMQQHLQAAITPLTRSWRSSPAIIHFVNQLFQHPVLRQQQADFPLHETHQQHLPGKVALLPMSRRQSEDNGDSHTPAMRNPLQQPRAETGNEHYYHEGKMIAAEIRKLITQKTAIQDNQNSRALRYDDIIILLRNRNHVADYETALREAGIPYIGANRGTLLESLEVRDMLDLLQWLILPFDNLSLAGILRSPLFAVSNDDLIALQQSGNGSWQDKLATFSEKYPDHPVLPRAWQLLQHWQQAATRLPVHDLLDKIYSEGNVIARYQAAFPQHLRPRVTANLTRFLELALEMDSGRYPGMSRFTDWLHELQQNENDAPDEPVSVTQHDEQRVQIMTIHAAKGLEAAVVFLADTAATPADRSTHAALVDWPADSEKPDYFMLTAASHSRDPFSKQCLAEQQRQQQREDANLLYVAVTRAKQILYISASEPRNRNGGWYQLVCDAFELEQPADSTITVCSHGDIATVAIARNTTSAPIASPEPALLQPVQWQYDEYSIAPSQLGIHTATGLGNEDNTRRGIVMHQMLEQLSRHPQQELQTFYSRDAQGIPLQQLQQWWQECSRTLENPLLQPYFDPGQFDHAWNEVAIQFEDNGKTVYGIIDRLVIRDNHAIVIDYKTHPYANEENIATLAAAHAAQMKMYQQGVQQLWPDYQVSCTLVFTATATGYHYQD